MTDTGSLTPDANGNYEELLGPGRRSVVKQALDSRVTVRVTPKMKEALERTAFERGTSVARLVRNLVSSQVSFSGQEVTFDEIRNSSDAWLCLRRFRRQDRKIPATVVFCRATGLGLRDAKDVVDLAWPYLIGSDLPPTDP